jgi:hypothetical protein
MRITIGYILPLAWLCACAQNDHGAAASSDVRANMPYQLGQALVIGESDSGELVAVDDDCTSAACQAVRERCGESAYADVVVDAEGEVLDVLCYRGNAQVEEIGSAAVDTASAGNNTVLVLDALDDGPDVTGDVVLTGNNAVIYGRGADVSEIGGDLIIDKNNAVVRSLSVDGDVIIDKNNAQLSFVEIHGDLTIRGNNTTVAKSVVHGAVHIEGVNTVLVQNRLAGERALSGKNLTCNGNVSFEAAGPGGVDAGADGGDAEGQGDAGVGTGASVTCSRSNGASGDHGRP